MNDEAVYRTAPATPGLLITLQYFAAKFFTVQYITVNCSADICIDIYKYGSAKGGSNLLVDCLLPSLHIVQQGISLSHFSMAPYSVPSISGPSLLEEEFQAEEPGVHISRSVKFLRQSMQTTLTAP